MKRTGCEPLKADGGGIARAGEIILAGGIVAFPTETFYGLGADARNEAALRKIFKIKGRAEKNPLLALIAHPAWVTDLGGPLPPIASSLMQKFWPGPLTLVFKSGPGVSPLLTGGSER